MREIAGEYRTFAVDNLENIYLFSPAGQLKKLNNKGDSTGVFNDVRRYGIPTAIDVSNPLKVLLYYKKFTTVVVLDRFLTLRNTLNLRKKGMFNVNAVATSYDNNLWIFDEQDFKLKKTDDELNPILESPDLRLLMDTVPSPQRIINRENTVYLYDTARGFYIFDNYGGYKNHLPFSGWAYADVSENTLYGFSGHILHSYRLQSLQLNEYRFPENLQEAISLKIYNGKLYALTSKGLKIYKL